MTVFSACSECEHYRSAIHCAAYPDRIPDRFWLGREVHLRVQPDQVGETVLLASSPEGAKRVEETFEITGVDRIPEAP